MNKAVLDTDLEGLTLPTRLRTWIASHGLAVLRDLVLWEPAELVTQRNLGRTSIADARLVVEGHLDCRWEDARAALLPTVDIPEPPGELEDAGWDDLCRTLPAEVLDRRLDELELPARVITLAGRLALHHVRDLVAISAAQLQNEPNLGRGSIRRTRQAFIDMATAPKRNESSTFIDGLKEQLGELSTVARLVITRRSGMADSVDTLQSIAETLGVTRERVRQIESKAFDKLRRHSAFLARLAKELDLAAPDGSVTLRDLSAYAWWSGVNQHRAVLAYYLDRVAECEFRLIEPDGVTLLSRFGTDQMDAVFASGMVRLRALEVPFAEAKFLELAASVSTELGVALGTLVTERLRAHLHVDEHLGVRMVTGIGRDRSAAILAYLRTAREPVRTREILAEFGRGHLPKDVLFLGRSVVGLEQHFPEMANWEAVLVPLCIAIMSESSQVRQWHALELVEGIRESAGLPTWFNHWHLASLLRRSPKISYLGRLRVALKSQDSSAERIQFKDALVEILVNADAPLEFPELTRRVRERTAAPEMSLRMRLQDPEFVRLDDTLWGLTDRDLPSGAASVTEIREFTHSLLRQRGAGVTAHQLWQSANAEGLPLVGYTPTMLASVAVGSDLVRSAPGGGIGLAQWDTARVRSQSQIVHEHLEKGDGSARIDEILLDIEQTHGKASTRAAVGQLAYQFGARMRGDHVQVLDWEAWQEDDGESEEADVPWPSTDLDGVVGILMAYAPPREPVLETNLLRRVYDVIDDPATGASISDQIFVDERIADKVATLKAGPTLWMVDLSAAASALYDLWLHHRTRGAQLSERALRFVRAGLHYLVNPADVIPDDTALIGHLDDAHAVHYCLDQLTAQPDWLGAGDG